MPNPNPTITPEFEQAAIDRRLEDLSVSDKLGDKVFCSRLPVDVQDFLTEPSGKKRTALMRKILVEVVRSQPDLLKQYEAELSN